MVMPMRIAARAFSSSIVQRTIQNVTIIGGGTMGSGIAQVAAQTGHNVIVVDVSSDTLKKSEKTIHKNIMKIASKKSTNPQEAESLVASTMERLSFKPDAIPAVQDSDLVVEAIIEKADLKKKLFKSIDSHAPHRAIFVSNTSAVSIAALAQVTDRRDRFGGMHFFNPVPMMKLVEVVRTDDMSIETQTLLTDFSKALQKYPVQAKDTPGFIVNRLFVPYLYEAIRMLERGDVTKEDLDMAMKLGLSHPMGPIQLADLVGLDTLKNAMDEWRILDPKKELFQPTELLDGLVKEGKLGNKSGLGFYEHKKN